MPRHPDYEKIYQNFVDQYGPEEGENKYFAWLKEHGYDDTKPFPKREGFSWAGSIKQMPGTGNLVRGQALHPLRTVHPEEWPQVREYLEEELDKSAHTLSGKPLVLDHCQVLDGKVLGAEYEDGAIEYVAQLNDPNVMKLIKDGSIKHCSVEYEWKSLEQVNGVAPRGINFTGLSLLRMFQPGDQKTTVEVWEGIVKELKEAKTAKTETENEPSPEEPAKESVAQQEIGISDGGEESPSAPPAETEEQAGDEEAEEGKLKEQETEEQPEEGEPEANRQQGADEKEVLGEAILAPDDSSAPCFVVSVEALEAVLPPLQAERSMSWGAQRFVQDVKRLIRLAKEDPRDGQV